MRIDTQRSPAQRTVTVALLLCVYVFISLAVFTPLHKHPAGQKCSLNGFDFQHFEGAVDAFTLTVNAAGAHLEAQPATAFAHRQATLSRSPRAPPALVLS